MKELHLAMKRLISAAAAGVLGAGMVVCAGGAANADVVADPGDVAGGISEPNTWPDSAADRAQAQAKIALAEAIFAAAMGDDESQTAAAVASTTAESDSDASKTVEQMLADYQNTYGTEALSEATEARLLDAAQPDSSDSSSSKASINSVVADGMVLSIAQYDQAKSYYCGPAAAQALLKGIGYGASADSGLALTQTNLAKDQYLSTETNGATTWDSYRMRKGMNRWRGDSYYIEMASPSGSVFQTLVYTAVHSGEGGNVDAVEFPYGEHYNKHPENLKIGHWTTIYGFTDNVVSVKLVDPSASEAVSWGNLPNDKFSYNAKNFAENFLQYNGAVY